MNLEEALRHLGATRVIWIDDHFEDTPEQLGRMLAANLEATSACDFPELKAIVEEDEYDPSSTQSKIVERLLETPQARRDAMKQAFFVEERKVEGAPAPEMQSDAIDEACRLLAIAPQDRWTFHKVLDKVGQTYAECDGDDRHVSYIVDLNDSRVPGSPNKSGVTILRHLATLGSKSTAFVLTHESAISDEGRLEEDLIGDMGADGVAPFPFSVVSKGRLVAGPPEVSPLEEAFRVAIKRAGLRRSLHEVLRLAEPQVLRSFEDAKRRLLRIPPEELDEHVVDKGFTEGLSELHVIERALTAIMSRDIRVLFGRDDEVRSAGERLRALHRIPLVFREGAVDENLMAFRDAETWDDGDLVNKTFSPLACGDVFEVDATEESVKSSKPSRFVLLGQPCDLQLRGKGTRGSRTAILVPLKTVDPKSPKAAGDKLMEYPLQCSLEGKDAICDLREATPAMLAILDLATFRDDGRVRFDKGQERHPGFLPGQNAIFAERTTWLSELITETEDEEREADQQAGIAADASVPSREAVASGKAKHGVVGRRLQLAFAAPTSTFKYVEVGSFMPAKEAKVNKVVRRDPARAC